MIDQVTMSDVNSTKSDPLAVYTKSEPQNNPQGKSYGSLNKLADISSDEEPEKSSSHYTPPKKKVKCNVCDETFENIELKIKHSDSKKHCENVLFNNPTVRSGHTEWFKEWNKENNTPVHDVDLIVL